VQIVSWNVQWCRGLDGVVDPVRIAAELPRTESFKVIKRQLAAQGTS